MDTHHTTPPADAHNPLRPQSASVLDQGADSVGAAPKTGTRLELVCGLAIWIAIGSVAAMPFFGVRTVGEALLHGSLFAVGAAIAAAGYLAPALFAYAMDHPQWRAIAVLNILLGSTGIGWAAAAVWAFIRPAQPPAA